MNKPSPSEPVGVILAIDPDRYTETLQALQQAGLTVTGEQPTLGTLSGTIPEDRITALKAVDGVESIDQDRTIQLPPP